MKEDQSRYGSMSLRGRRDFLQSLIGLAAVAVLPVPIGVVLAEEPSSYVYPYTISWKCNFVESNDIIVIYDGFGREIYRKA